MSYQQSSSVITRKARVWPELPADIVTLPTPPVLPDLPQSSIYSTIFLSLAGLAVYGYVFTNLNTGEVGFLIIPFIAISSSMAAGSLIVFLVQLVRTLRHRRYLVQHYHAQLQEAEQRLKLLHWHERQAWMELDPPLARFEYKSSVYKHLDVKPLLQYPYSDQNMNLWARQPGDPDFMRVRIGIEQRPATYTIRDQRVEGSISLPARLKSEDNYAKSLLEAYARVFVPLCVDLRQQSPLAIVGPGHKIVLARELMHSIVSQVAYHHSPEDVRIIILAPYSQEVAWQWSSIIPHTLLYDTRLDGAPMPDTYQERTCAIGTAAVMDQLPVISRELNRRALLLDDGQRYSPWPHLLIVVDAFDGPGDLDQPTPTLPAMVIPPSHPTQYRRTRLPDSPLRRPEMALALNRGHQLGVSVLCLCTSRSQMPQTSQLFIDLNEEQPPGALLPASEEKVAGKKKHKKIATDEEDRLMAGIQARVHSLRENPQSARHCLQLDSAGLEDLRSFALRLQSLRAMSTRQIEMRTQVDLSTLFDPPLDLNTYDPFVLWNDPLFRTPRPMFRFPIGLKIGDEIQYLDLHRDGPHGLLIGQTGSGKSELLQTIVLSLAFLYKPTEVNFLLIDHRAGLAWQPFAHLPHTTGFLTNVSSPATIRRFVTMLGAEANRREALLKEGKTLPSLIIIIDEFAEMIRSETSMLDDLLNIMQMGRKLEMYVLLAAQRPEEIIISRIREYVQYRLCLRCASPEDSREVLRRIDAAALPASIPGRGYLLHGDNQLDLFQAARVTLPFIQDQMASAQAQLNSLLSLPFKGK
ncbi:FtsK/SpoIIIE domain-containing protein [Dictyobacter aurantiacus]|nr:FtsK/SpoIIIE domain-containing protein [Dictyobacter aurantiacus]